MEILVKLSLIVLMFEMRGRCQNEDYYYDSDYDTEPEVDYSPPFHFAHNIDYSGPQVPYPNDCARECFCSPAFPLTMFCDNRKLKDIPKIPSHIQQLHLQFNEIEAVTSRSFINATALKEINLSHNKIKSNKIEAGVFAKLRNLEQLFMHHNDLEEVPTSLPRSIERFFLGFNKIFKIKDQDFQELKKLTMLDLCNNHIDSVKGNAFLKLEKLMQLNICNNKLSSMPLSLPQSLMYLSVENNSISKIPEDYFNKLHNLLAIRMSHNILKEIPKKMFNLPKLMELNLGHNKLQQVFYVPRSLEHLYLQDNEFEILNVTIMCPMIDPINMNHLTYLRVDQNRLKVPISTYAYICFPHLRNIYYGEQKHDGSESPRVLEPALLQPVSEEEDEDDDDMGNTNYYQQEHGAEYENDFDDNSY